MKEFNDSAKESKALGFYFDNSQYESQTAALANVVKQYAGSLNSGSADPETYIPEFLSALEDAGIDEVIAAKQEQFDKWLSEQ